MPLFSSMVWDELKDSQKSQLVRIQLSPSCLGVCIGGGLFEAQSSWACSHMRPASEGRLHRRRQEPDRTLVVCRHAGGLLSEGVPSTHLLSGDLLTLHAQLLPPRQTQSCPPSDVLSWHPTFFTEILNSYKTRNFGHIGTGDIVIIKSIPNFLTSIQELLTAATSCSPLSI